MGWEKKTHSYLIIEYYSKQKMVLRHVSRTLFISLIKYTIFQHLNCLSKY